jgi:hypothetical protein
MLLMYTYRSSLSATAEFLRLHARGGSSLQEIARPVGCRVNGPISGKYAIFIHNKQDIDIPA